MIEIVTACFLEAGFLGLLVWSSATERGSSKGTSAAARLASDRACSPSSAFRRAQQRGDIVRVFDGNVGGGPPDGVQVARRVSAGEGAAAQIISRLPK